MAEVNHTNPATGESFGDSQVFARGRIAVVDGGEADRHPDDGSEDADDHDDEPMGEIDHTPREDAPDTSEVYARGGENEDRSEDDPDVEADV